MSQASGYRHDPFKAGKKRRRKKSSAKKISSPEKKRLVHVSKGSFYDDTCDGNTSKETVYSASHKKLIDLSKILPDIVDENQQSSEDEDHDEMSDCEANDETDKEHTGEYYWITDFKLLEAHLKNVAVCKDCHHELTVKENRNFRDGLGTKFHFECSNKLCSSLNNNDAFLTTQKDKRIFNINRASVLGSRIIGKGRAGLLKLCSVIGLSTPVSKQSFSEHTSFLEKKAFELRSENLKLSAEKAKKLHCKYTKESPGDVIDIAVSFDGSWNSRGWLAKKGFASAVAENTSQVIDIIYKDSTCRQCEQKKLQFKEKKLDTLEYLTWYTEHEENCFQNHDGSPQVCKFSLH